MINLALEQDHFGWIIWIFTELMNKKQCIQFGIFAIELFLPAFEKICPEENSLKGAIEAAKAYLKRPSKRTKKNVSVAYDIVQDIDDSNFYNDAFIYDIVVSTTYIALAVSFDLKEANDAIYSSIVGVADAYYDIVVSTTYFEAIDEELAIQKKIIDKGIEILKIK